MWRSRRRWKHSSCSFHWPLLLSLLLIFKFYLNLTLSSVLIIGNIKTVSLPADPSCFGFLYRVYQRSHSIGICGIRLHQVDDVEAIRVILPRVLDLEVVPLCEAPSAIIIFEIQIVFEVAAIINFS